MKQLEQDWYQSSLTWRTALLLPLSCVFRFVVATRRFLYRMNLKKSFQFDIPTIIVGNITVGGTGKTPFVIWLAEKLREKGLSPGIVSRGVGGKMQMTPRWVTEASPVNQVGDEALLLLKRTKCPLVIGIDRVACVRELLSKTNCNVVISDDGLQHYRLRRKIEIALIDGARELGNKQMLPAGPLREPVSRLNSVNFVVKNGQATSNEIQMQLQSEAFRDVKSDTIQSLHSKKIHVVTGIGNPQRFFIELRHMGFELIEHVFPDHYLYAEKDLVFSDDLPIVMTEKDAVKCKAFVNEKMFYLPVNAVLDEKLLKNILSCLQGTFKNEKGLI